MRVTNLLHGAHGTVPVASRGVDSATFDDGGSLRQGCSLHARPPLGPGSPRTGEGAEGTRVPEEVEDDDDDCDDDEEEALDDEDMLRRL